MGVELDKPVILLLEGSLQAIQNLKNERKCEAAEKLKLQLGLAFNPANKKIHTVDARYTVMILSSGLNFKGSFGSFGINKGQFSKPYSIACDTNGKVYVTDTENHRIQIFTADRHILTAFGKCGTR